MSLQGERELVEICFELVLVSTESTKILAMSREQKADWVRKQLRDCRFEVSDPVGSSWGYLIKEKCST